MIIIEDTARFLDECLLYISISLSLCSVSPFLFLYSIDTQRDVYIYDGVKERKKASTKSLPLCKMARYIYTPKTRVFLSLHGVSFLDHLILNAERLVSPDVPVEPIICESRGKELPKKKEPG